MARNRDSVVLALAQEPLGRLSRVATAAVGLWMAYLAVGPSGLFLGPRVMAGVTSGALLAVAWGRSGNAVELRANCVRVPTWRPPAWATEIPIDSVACFVVLPWRGGTLGVRLVDGSTVKTSVQRTLWDATTRHDRVAEAVDRLNRAMGVLRHSRN